MLTLSFRFRFGLPVYLDARRSAATDCAQTSPSPGALAHRTAIHRAERSCSTRSLQGTHALRPRRQRYAPLPNWRSTRTTSTHFPRCNSLTPARHPAHGQPNSSTHWHYNPHTTTRISQRPIHFPHQHPHTPHHQHPIGQPHNPTQTPSGQADSALQTEYTHKLPVVRSQHAERALLPGAAVHQRNGKDTPMAHQ
jgi:hypothetical protein